MTELSLMNIILIFLSSIMISVFITLCWQQCIEKRVKFFQKILIIFILSSVITVLTFMFPKEIRIISTFLFLTLVSYTCVVKEIKESLFLTIIAEVVISLAESSFIMLIALICKGQMPEIMNRPIMFLLLHLYIFIVSSILLWLKVPARLYEKLGKAFNSIKNNEVIIYSIVIIAIIIISTIETHMKLPLTVVIITNCLMAVTFISIIIMSSKTKAKYNKISNKYITSITSLKEYEVMIDKFRVSGHENKNELLTIRNMINDKKAINYIDTLIDNKIKDNEKIMHQTSKIPEGGLRATIYSKLCTIEKYKIKYGLNISREVRTADLINIDDELTLKICKILGVFLDNAIEAVKHLRKKQIVIEMYIDDNYLYIAITNNFKGNLDLEKISSVKYTTKGDGRGYGLALVNQILKEEHGKLENEKSINGDMFTQILKIKM